MGVGRLVGFIIIYLKPTIASESEFSIEKKKVVKGPRSAKMHCALRLANLNFIDTKLSKNF